MALIDYTKVKDLHSKRFSWIGATNGGTPDTFAPVEIDRNPYTITVQATGTFGASADIALHGSLDGTNYAALSDAQGAAISLTAASIADGQSAVRFVKPVLSGGNGSTDIDVVLQVRFDTY